MKDKHGFKRTLLMVLPIALLSCGGTPDEESAFYGELNPNAPAETIQFGQLVGKWEVISSDSLAGEGWHESKAIWIYQYILDGYAVKDIWREKFSDYTSNTKNLGRDFTGMNVRIFDPATRTWKITWIENGKNTMINNLTAKMNEKGDIVMKSPNSNSEATFYDITEDNFSWKFEILQGGDRILFSRMLANRLK